MTHSTLLFPALLFLVGAALSHFGVWNLPRVQQRAEAARERGDRLSTNQRTNLNAASRVRLFKILRVFFGILGLILLVAAFVH